jgi:hypothetical protein
MVSPLHCEMLDSAVDSSFHVTLHGRMNLNYERVIAGLLGSEPTPRYKLKAWQSQKSNKWLLSLLLHDQFVAAKAAQDAEIKAARAKAKVEALAAAQKTAEQQARADAQRQQVEMAQAQMAQAEARKMDSQTRRAARDYWNAMQPRNAQVENFSMLGSTAALGNRFNMPGQNR